MIISKIVLYHYQFGKEDRQINITIGIVYLFLALNGKQLLFYFLNLPLYTTKEKRKKRKTIAQE
jgi:hypothetical protein